jgi:hypothetical protein
LKGRFKTAFNDHFEVQVLVSCDHKVTDQMNEVALDIYEFLNEPKNLFDELNLPLGEVASLYRGAQEFVKSRRTSRME